MNFPVRVAIVIAVIWLAAVIFCWWLQRKVLFYPNQEMGPYRPTNYNKFYVDEEGNGTPDPTGNYLSGWFIPGKTPKTVFFCHGNTGNISHRDYMVELCQLFGLGLILFDYSGYGESKGNPGISTVIQDAERVYLYARSFLEPEHLIVWGESLGGSAATAVASKYRCGYLVLLATFSSLDDILIYSGKSLLGYGLRLVSDTLRSKDRIRKVTCPVAIVHSKDDNLIPIDCARCLYQRVLTPKMLLEVHGGHATPVTTVQQLRELMDFIGSKERPSDNEVQRVLNQIRTAAYRHGLV